MRAPKETSALQCVGARPSDTDTFSVLLPQRASDATLRITTNPSAR